jgi:hypothetical protein
LNPPEVQKGGTTPKPSCPKGGLLAMLDSKLENTVHQLRR